MNKINISILFLLISVTTFYGQSKKEEAFEIAKKAITIMDNGNYDEAIKLLKKSEKLDKKNVIYPYEIAFAHYSKKEYEKAILILEKLINRKGINDRIFQLLGNSYDYIKQPEKALETYKKGIKKFPKSGKLFLEQGILENERKNYNKAIEYWELGIKAEPSFSSNYYWLGKTFSYTNERIWSVIYSEIFINLERNSKRTKEISKLLFNTYKKSIKVSSDSTGGVEFSKRMVIDINDKPAIPLEMSFGLTMTLSLGLNMLNNEKEFSIHSLNNIRQNFISNWFKQKRNKEYPNVLFNFQKKLKDKGYFEAYNYWILMQGVDNEFHNWNSENEEHFNDFVIWFNDNPIIITRKNYFSRVK